jgi:phosphoribosyl 1,2-cyclic phosphate phosphodiesterase
MDSVCMADFALTFLGTGTSLGIPLIGCDCEVCASHDPCDKRTRASIYCETPECAWGVDAGPDFRSQALRENIRRMDAVLFTHAHTDHVMGFDDLRPFCFGGRKLPVYASAETMATIQRVFAFAFEDDPRSLGYLRPEPHIVSGPFMLGETAITPLPVPHGRVTTFGYLFERRGRKLAAYLSDCKEVPPPVLSAIAGVEVLILDALRHKPHGTHMNVEEALAVATHIGAPQTWLTHLCHELGHSELSRALPGSVRVAYDGLKLSL